MAMQAAINFLCDRYPRCFSLENPQPLKVGISRDIRAERPAEISGSSLDNAMRWYTHRAEYLQTMVEGRNRIDLNGDAVGMVTAEAAEHAQRELAGPPKRSGLADLKAAAIQRQRNS